MQDLFDRYAGRRLWERTSARAERRPQVGRSGLMQRLGFDDPWAAVGDPEAEADPLLFVSGRAYRRWMQRRLMRRFWMQRDRGFAERRSGIGQLTLGRVRFPGEGRGGRPFFGWGPSLGTGAFVLPERALQQTAEEEHAREGRSRAWHQSLFTRPREPDERVIEVIREVPVPTPVVHPASGARAAPPSELLARTVASEATTPDVLVPAPTMTSSPPVLPSRVDRASARPLPPQGRVARLEAAAPSPGLPVASGPAAASPLLAGVFAPQREGGVLPPVEVGARVAARLERAARPRRATARLAERAQEAREPLWTGHSAPPRARRAAPGVRRLALASPAVDAVLKGLPDAGPEPSQLGAAPSAWSPAVPGRSRPAGSAPASTPDVAQASPSVRPASAPTASSARLVRTTRSDRSPMEPADRPTATTARSVRKAGSERPPMPHLDVRVADSVSLGDDAVSPGASRPRVRPMTRALVGAEAPTPSDSLAPALLEALRTGRGRTRVAGRRLRLRWAGASEILVRPDVPQVEATPSKPHPAPRVTTATVYRTPDGRFVGARSGTTASSAWSGAGAVTTPLAPWSGAKSASTPASAWSGAASTTTSPGAWRGMHAVRTAVSAFRGSTPLRSQSSPFVGAAVQRTLAGDWTGAPTARTAAGDWSGAQVLRTEGGPDWVGAGVSHTASGAFTGAPAFTTRPSTLSRADGVPLVARSTDPDALAPDDRRPPVEGTAWRRAATTTTARGAWSGAPIRRISRLPWTTSPVAYAGSSVPRAGARIVRMVRGPAPDAVPLSAALTPAGPHAAPRSPRVPPATAPRPLEATAARFLAARSWSGAPAVRTGALGATDQELFELATRPWSGAARVRAALARRGTGRVKRSMGAGFTGSTTWHTDGGEHTAGARRSALRAPLETTLGAAAAGELPADAPGWAARTGAHRVPPGDFFQALARARDPEEVLRIIVQEQTAPRDLGLSAPTARVVQTLRKQEGAVVRPASTSGAVASPALLRSGGRRGKPSTVRVISGWGSASVGARGAGASEAVGEDRVSGLVKRLRGLVLLAEKERRVSDAQAQVRMHAEGAPDPAESGGDADEESGGGQKDVDALGQAILPKVLDELELRRQRRPEDASEY